MARKFFWFYFPFSYMKVDRGRTHSRDFKIVHYGRLGRLDGYTGGLGP